MSRSGAAEALADLLQDGNMWETFSSNFLRGLIARSRIFPSMTTVCFTKGQASEEELPHDTDTVQMEFPFFDHSIEAMRCDRDHSRE